MAKGSIALRLFMRDVLRNRGTYVINAIGLSLGVGSCLLIMLFIQDETSFDAWLPRADRTYRLTWEVPIEGGPKSIQTPLITMTRIREWIPQLERATAIQKLPSVVVTSEAGSFSEERFYLADSSFFDVFPCTFVRGDPRSALASPDAVVLSQSTARRYFGDLDPVGRTIWIPGKGALMVRAVVSEMPSQTHFHADLIAPFAARAGVENPWADQGHIYIVLKEGAAPDDVERILDANSDVAHIGWWVRGLTFRLQPVRSIHLHSHVQGELEANSDVRYIYIYSAIAIVLLLIASANYVNLALARSMHRSREVGIRKVLGASRWRLIRTYLGEALAVSLVAVPLAVGFGLAVLPLFNEILQKQIVVGNDRLGDLALASACLALVVGTLSGLYPAVALSAYRPVDVLRSSWSPPVLGLNVRKGLVVLQFGLAIALIIATAFVFRQMQFLQNADLGFRKDGVVIVPVGRTTDAGLFQRLKNELLRSSSVEAVAAASGTPIDPPALVDKVNGRTIQVVMVDEDYVPLLGLTVVRGRNFSALFGGDTAACMLNEAAVEALGLDVPSGRVPAYGGGSVVGVVKDFHNRSLRSPIEPLILRNEPRRARVLLISVRAGELDNALRHVRSVWRSILPDRPFEHALLSDRYAALYQTEGRLQDVIAIFSLLQVGIACLGLYGLSAFVVQRRTREFGIRRVLGASTVDVVGLQSREFAGLVALANVIAWPVADVLVALWLEEFAYRVDLDPLLFVFGGAVAFLVAMTTVGAHAFAAARMHPSQALRYE